MKKPLIFVFLALANFLLPSQGRAEETQIGGPQLYDIYVPIEAQEPRTWTDDKGREIKGCLKRLRYDHENIFTATVEVTVGIKTNRYDLLSTNLSDEDNKFLASLKPKEKFKLPTALLPTPPPILNPYPEFKCGWKWSDVRTWTRNDSSTITGKFELLTDTSVIVMTATGKAELALADLTRGDRIYAFRAQAQKGPYPTKATVKFTELRTDEREMIPSYNQSRSKYKNTCMANSLFNTVLWWEQMGVLPIEMNQKNIDTFHASTAGQGLKPLIGYEAGWDCDVSTTSPQKMLQDLELLAQGGNAVSIAIDLKFYARGHAITLVSVNKEAETVTLRTWGESFTCKVVSRNGVVCLKLTNESLKNAPGISRVSDNGYIKLNFPFRVIAPDGTGKYF